MPMGWKPVVRMEESATSLVSSSTSAYSSFPVDVVVYVRVQVWTHTTTRRTLSNQ
jgi:hypothetical protein